MLALILAGLALAQDCALDGPADAPFQVHDLRTTGTLAVVEIWLQGSPPGWAEAVLAQMHARNLPATLVVRPEDAPARASLAGTSGDEWVVVLDAPSEGTVAVPVARRAAAQVRQAVGERPRTVATSTRTLKPSI